MLSQCRQYKNLRRDLKDINGKEGLHEFKISN